MAQRSQHIDVTRSYLPISPDSLLENLINTDREDGEEKALPIVAYDGYNFLPTTQGYRSYFGIESKLDISSLASRAQFIISFQLPTYQTRLIALCEDGIWLANAGSLAAPWTQAVTLTFDPAVLKEWSYCIIENILYMYSAGGDLVYKTNITALLELEILSFTPSFLNMAGQLGIFKAGTRLGFWDSANSISWSSNLDLTDFTPSLENLTGNTIFGDIIGRVITVKGHRDGFVVYSTRSILGVGFSFQSNLLWEAKKIMDSTGISYSRAVTVGQNDGEHFVYSTSGIYRIGEYTSLTNSFQVDPIATDFYDYIRETRDPVYLDIIAGRYLFFHIVDVNYVYSGISFQYVPGTDQVLLIGGNPWTLDPLALPATMSGNAVAAAINQIVTFGFQTFPNKKARWNLDFSITQPGTDSPLTRISNPTGPFTRAAQNPGFTASDILNTYIEGTTLPTEYDPVASIDSDSFRYFLGSKPVYPATVTGAMGIDMIETIQKQIYDWRLFLNHQQAAANILVTLTKTKPVVQGTSIIDYVSASSPIPPAPPDDLIEDTVVGNYRTGEGNLEFQMDFPQNMLYLRKYFQRKFTVTRRKRTVYTYRVDTAAIVLGRRLVLTDLAISGNAGTPLTPNPIYVSCNEYALNDTELRPKVNAAFLASAPATVNSSTYGNVGKTSATWSSPGTGYTFVEYGPGVNYLNLTSINSSSANVVPYYLDSQVTYSYLISYADADMGYAQLTGTQTDNVVSTTVVTSYPPTIVLTSPTPIFPTGPSAVSFFPPTWNGVETLRMIAASAFSPWRYDGSYGISLDLDPLAGYNPATDMPVDVGSMLVYGDSFIVRYPGTPYLLQSGVPFLAYPTFNGSYVLDLHLKKWGKQKNQFTVLGSLDAINQTINAILPTPDKGMTAFLKIPSNEIRIIDELPTDSLLKYGRIGHSRLGYTNLLEVKAWMRTVGYGSLVVEASIDGKQALPTLQHTTNFNSYAFVEAYPDISARWFNINLMGSFDLVGLEARTKVVSRR
jgi:hypothetical protein